MYCRLFYTLSFLNMAFSYFMAHVEWLILNESISNSSFKALSSSCNGMKISKSSLCWEFWFVILNFSSIFVKSWSIFWNFGRFSLDLWESHSMASPNNSFSHEQHVSNKSRNCLGRDQSHDKINLLIGANPRPIGELWVFLIFTYHFYRGTHIESRIGFYYCMLGVCCNWWKREC